MPTHSFQIKDLPTSSVTLFPSRAHVVREIDGLVLSPGENEVEILGLAPTVDEHSIQIEGKGSATVTDIRTELVPNTEDFDELYPDPSDTEESELDDYEDSDDEIEPVRVLSQQIKEIDAFIAAAEDKQQSANNQLQTLEKHSESIEQKNCAADELEKILTTYQEQRQRIASEKAKVEKELGRLEKLRRRREAEKVKAGREESKRKLALEKEKQKLKDKRARQREERWREAQRIKNEHMNFWPSQTYKIKVTLELSSDTPATSRRNSLDSITLARATPESLNKLDQTQDGHGSVSLKISYVTTSASWTPRYDFTISSVKKTATIVYRAQLSNKTSETWKDAKISLSTSQTSFSGLDDKAPQMNPWNVRLGRTYGSEIDGLFSNDESSPTRNEVADAQKKEKRKLLGRGAGGPPQIQAAAPVHAFGGAVGGAPGAPSFSMVPPPPLQVMRSAAPQAQVERVAYQSQTWSGPPRPVPALLDEMDEDEGADGLDFEESSWEDNGLTATYEIPGTRTVSPSSVPHGHKIATLNAAGIELSHITVPKLRAAAFLRARIRNPSNSVTLLKGNAGITLDGSFLGNLTLQRVSPGQSFSLPLGVDPAIHISYPKPTVHRSTQGIFNKESAHVFNRSIFLTNTKPTPVELLVLDQVPVSQDERLKIDITHPRGLNREGDTVKTGHAAKEGNVNWGKATANLKKNGEIAYTVRLEKGQAGVLKLSYDARLPSSEGIVTV